MYCRNCGQPGNDNQAICLKCGSKTGIGNAFCFNCGTSIANDVEFSEFCLSCGVALRPPRLNGQNKGVILLVCLFLGGLGIHNFMMGETKRGVARILLTALLCGVGGILALIDFIRIALDSYTVDKEAIF
ncbi:MAG: NINE protein [Myxococcaceae bacterium]|nr:NINE protein [Myxococcaceae bacterium]